jgi:hypothetical protein
MAIRAAVVLGLCLAAAGCDWPLGPSTRVSLVGTSWAGSFEGSVGTFNPSLGRGTLTITVEEDIHFEHIVAGRWASTYADISKNEGGTWSGTWDDRRVFIYLHMIGVSETDVCSIHLSATLDVNGSRMAGSITTLRPSCSSSGAISITLTKQY